MYMPKRSFLRFIAAGTIFLFLSTVRSTCQRWIVKCTNVSVKIVSSKGWNQSTLRASHFVAGLTIARQIIRGDAFSISWIFTRLNFTPYMTAFYRSLSFCYSALWQSNHWSISPFNVDRSVCNCCAKLMVKIFANDSQSPFPIWYTIVLDGNSG